MSVETIARRYGGALADIVIANGETETVAGELAAFNSLFTENTTLTTMFANPAISHANKEKVLEAIIAKAKPSKTTANFARILLQNGRLSEITEVATRFRSILDERSGVVKAEVISASQIGDSERAEFKAELEKKTGKQITLEFKVDESIIGGVITRVGSTVYDGSVRTKLDNLKEQLVNG